MMDSMYLIHYRIIAFLVFPIGIREVVVFNPIIYGSYEMGESRLVIGTHSSFFVKTALKYSIGCLHRKFVPFYYEDVSVCASVYSHSF